LKTLHNQNVIAMLMNSSISREIAAMSVAAGLTRQH
jgi:hypothetical protein